jgi:dephospho-CoA kinase
MPSHSQGSEEKRLVIGIAGRIGAGKTSAAKHLNTKHGFQYLRYSQVLAEWMAANPESKAQLQRIGWEVMAGGMQTELNRRLIAQVNPQGNAAIDGLRHATDYESLCQAFSSSFHLLYIDSGAEQRWKHVSGKGRYTSRDIFDAADSHPVEQQIESLRAKASLALRNEGLLEGLYTAIDHAVPSFREEGRQVLLSPGRNR